MKALLELRKQIEIDFLKTKTYEEINDMFNQLKDKLDIAEAELKKLRVADVTGAVCKKCGDDFMPRLFKELTICDKCHDKFLQNVH